jgi:hypothetical protein
MGLVELVRKKQIQHWLNKASSNGYGGVTVYYALYLPPLTSEMKEELKEKHIKVSEMQWDSKSMWRRFYWDTNGGDMVVPPYHIF